MREEFLDQNRYPIPYDPMNPGTRDVPGGGYLPVGPIVGSMNTMGLVNESELKVSEIETFKEKIQHKHNKNISKA